MNSSLEGLKVIDFTQVIMGPSCTAQLADHGAEVIKIERPEYGELTRQFGPFKDGESLPYESYNRNKKSIAVNLKSKEGKKIIYKLASKSDVIVNNFRPGVMDSLGFSYEDLYKINKKIIYACGSGFGLSGPLKEKMGHESVAEALGGFLGKNGEKGRKPRRAPGAVADASTGLHLTVGILLALNARHKTGEGQVVDVSLLDSMMWMQGWEVSSASNLDQVTFNPDPLDSGVYETGDGLIVMSGLFISNPLKNISEVIGVEDLSKDERFKSMDDIAKNASDLLEIIQNKIIKKDSEYWVNEFEKSNIICSKILGMEEAINQPQIKHNKIIVEIKKKNIKRNIVGVPVRLSKTPGSIRTFPPKLGENTEEVLLSLGYKSTEISDFKNKKVVE